MFRKPLTVRESLRIVLGVSVGLMVCYTLMYLI